MGFFEFKNVSSSKEVFAITNAGLTIPHPESLTGKTKLKNFRKEADHNFLWVIKDLWYRKVFLAASLYLIGLWVLMKAADLIISNYAISPYWTDIFLVFFLSFLPSVILHSYYHNKLEINKLRMVEKVTIPSNGMLSIALLVFLFGGKDLGSTTLTVLSKDEFGNRIEKQIVKNEFRKKINFYPFTNETGDSTLEWLRNGITDLLAYDLAQDEYTWCAVSFSYKTLGAMLKNAESRNTPKFITGSFKKKDSLYIVTSQLYDSKIGKLIQERTFSGQNLFDLSDEISVQIKKDLGMSAYHIQNVKDLPVKSILTDNLEAYRQHLHIWVVPPKKSVPYFLKADKLDPSFAINNYWFAYGLHLYQFDQNAAKVAIDKAMKYRAKVSDQYNMRIRTLYYQIYDQPEKAIALREMQAELNPEDSDAYSHLMTEYHRIGYYEKSLEACKDLCKLFPELTYLEPLQAWLLKLLNRPDEALEIMESFVKRFPKNSSGFERLGDVHLAMGNLDEAENYFNKVSLMEPENRGMPLMLDHIQYLREKGDNYKPEMLKQFAGEYKFTGTEMVSKYIYLNKKIMIKAKNLNIFQMYPINDSTMVSISGIEKTFIKNKAGIYYKLISKQNGATSELYTIDESIKKAEKLFAEGNDEAALEAYEAAYAQNREHHFLNNYIQHLNLKKNKKANSYISHWQKWVGKYHDYASITLKDGRLYWSEVDEGLKWQMLPINEKEFLLSEMWGYKAVLVEKNGKAIGLDWISSDGSIESLTKVD